MNIDDVPYWLRGERPLSDYQSRAELPTSADVVVIGAGLTGASAAYHLAEERTGAHVVVLERGEPAGEASGRNGGNFEMLPENSVGMYEGLAAERAAFLHKRYANLPAAIIHAESERQTSAVLGLSLRNRELLKSIILREQIDCDFAPRGWLHLACSEDEEQGMCDELRLAAQHGQRIELWSRRKIRQEFGIETAFLGRFIPGDGTYHPFRYVVGLLQCAIRAGVELYTGVRVTGVVSHDADHHDLATSRGTIVARRLIAATNAFTSEIFPELSAIRPHQSQIQVTEGAPDRARGRVVTCEQGPVFFNQPRDRAEHGYAPLLMGGGPDRPIRNPSSRRRSPQVHDTLLALRSRYYPELDGRTPSTEWVGTMAFTPDQLPAIGFLRGGVVIAAGYNGYGGSYTTAAGQAAALMALRGTTPEWVAEDVFSPRRLMTTTPLFMTAHDSLWRIATSLCRQLQLVNRRIAETLALRSGAAPAARRRTASMNVTQMLRAVPHDPTPAATIDPAMVQVLPGFGEFSTDDAKWMLDFATRCDLPARRVLFREGDPGDSCFLVVSGEVDASIKARGQRHLLARMGPGTMFGQVSLISSEPRTMACSIRRDATLVRLDRVACETLLRTQSPAALAFLGVLTHGLTEALRSADRRLMQLEQEDGTTGTFEP